MRTSILLFILAFALALSACRNEQAAGQATAEAAERAFREWQEHLDKNEFEQVRAMSTPETESLIALVEDLAQMMPEDSTTMHTEFSSLECKLLTDSTAMCYYSIPNEEFMGQESLYQDSIYYDSIDLVLRHGRWLVHSPLRVSGDDLDLEDLFEEDFFNSEKIPGQQ